jgi:hypothetical protein
MPIGDSEGYDNGHFKHVYENIIKPACSEAGFNAVRADDVKETNLIHLDILKKLIDAPIAICDLSTRNPNVLFELGIRQAFDKPVVLIQEKGTEKIFDIAPLRYLEYSKEMKYHDVLKSQQDLKVSLEATMKANGEAGNVNSIVKLLALNNAAMIPSLEGNSKETLAFEILQSEMRDMRHMFEIMMMERKKAPSRDSIAAIEYERISNELDKIKTNRIPMEERHRALEILMRDAEELMMNSNRESDHRHYRMLMERVHRTMKEFA